MEEEWESAFNPHFCQEFLIWKISDFGRKSAWGGVIDIMDQQTPEFWQGNSRENLLETARFVRNFWTADCALRR